MVLKASKWSEHEPRLAWVGSHNGHCISELASSAPGQTPTWFCVQNVMSVWVRQHVLVLAGRPYCQYVHIAVCIWQCVAVRGLVHWRSRRTLFYQCDEASGLYCQSAEMAWRKSDSKLLFRLLFVGSLNWISLDFVGFRWIAVHRMHLQTDASLVQLAANNEW